VAFMNPAYWWKRRSLTLRLLVSAGLALFLSGSMLLYTTVQNAVDYERQNMLDRLGDELKSFAPLLAEQAVIGDYATIEQMLKVRAGRKSVDQAVWTDSSGQSIVAVSETVSTDAPSWFSSWLNLPPQEGSVPVALGGETYGEVRVKLTPNPGLNLIWHTFVKQSQILLAGYLAFIVVTIVLLRYGMRPLYQLAQGAQRFGQGDYSVRIEPLAAPEILPSIQAFNKMAQEISTLLESMRKFTLAVEHSANSVVITNRRGDIEYVNPKFTQVAGYPLEEIKGQNPRFLKGDMTSADEYRRLWETIDSGGEWRGEFHNRHKDGGLYWVSASISPILNEKGEITHFVAIEEDITARKEAEATLYQLNQTLEQRVQEEVAKNREKDHLLIHQSRLAAMGEMIGNIAHQWRQPLNGLALLLINLKDAQEFNELNQLYLEETVGKAEQLIRGMSTTIDDFRNFFRPNREKTLFPLEQAVLDALAMVEASFKDHKIEITLHTNGDPHVLGFRNEYAQVVTNLLANAKDAILSHKEAIKGRVDISIGGRNEGKCMVTISDNGGGIPESVLGKIFDPYFTTREKGTGIGLYMSKMIIENNMGGSIEARNTEEGAAFSIVTACGEVLP
jgi:PAS domain S-box-containing protein